MTLITNIFITITTISVTLFNPIISEIISCPHTSTECHCPITPSIPGETCIFNCTKEDSCKSTILHCRPGTPCEIRCKSKAACSVSLTIDAYTSTHVNLICNGEDTCKSLNILKCGTGDCTISCNGEDSCKKFGTINTTNANSFQCNGQCSFPNIPNYFHDGPSLYPTIRPSISPTQTILPISTAFPTIAPSINDNNTSDTPILEAIISTSYAPTISPTTINTTQSVNLKDKNVSKFNLYSITSQIHPLYYVIALLLILIFIVCCVLFCWVYVSHSHTQKLIAAQKLSKKFDDSKISVNFNESKLNIPTSHGFAMSKSPTSMINNHILTPTNTSQIPKMLRVHSDNSTIGSPIATLTIDTIELQQCITKSNDLIAVTCDTNTLRESHTPIDEGTGYNTNNSDECKDGDNITIDNYYKNHLKMYNNNNLIPPPPPLPLPHLPPPISMHYNHNINNMIIPPPPTHHLLLPVRKSNIPPPPKNNSNNNNLYANIANYYEYDLCDGKTDTLTLTLSKYDNNSHYNSIDDIDNEHDLSDDTIMKHLNTIDSDFDGEDDINSMRAVRHPTLTTDTQSYDISPQINVQITTPDGMSNISLKRNNNMEQAMENIKKEIYDIAQKLQFHQPPQIYIKKKNTNMCYNDNCDNKFEIEMPDNNSKSVDSFSLGNTPRPKEYSNGSNSNGSNSNNNNNHYNNNSNIMVMDMNENDDRNSYAIQLVAMDEPTYTNSTRVDDTYLKYLNM